MTQQKVNNQARKEQKNEGATKLSDNLENLQAERQLTGKAAVFTLEGDLAPRFLALLLFFVNALLVVG